MNNGVLLLKAAEASITTCTVTIQAIKINNRQMTQAIFNQLPAEDLLDEETLNVPETTAVWGWVNYRPKASPDFRDTQFVVQKDERLVRCPFRVRRLDKKRYDCEEDMWPGPLRAASHRSYAEAALCLLAQAIEGSLVYHAEKGRYNTHYQRYWVAMGFPFGHREFSDEGGDSLITTAVGKALKDMFRPEPDKLWDKDSQQVVDVQADAVAARGHEVLRTALIKLAGEASGRPTGPMIAKSAFWRSRLDQRAAEATDYIKRWNGLMDQLDTAEQLYIAT